MTAPDLRTRLERAYMDATGSPTGRGAIGWIADLAGLTASHVSDMLRGEESADRLESELRVFDEGRRVGAEQAVDRLRETLTG